MTLLEYGMDKQGKEEQKPPRYESKTDENACLDGRLSKCSLILSVNPS
jgi:hypothetical protein